MNKIHKDDYFILAVFCIDYHSGQWSRGYRILSKLYPFKLTDNCIKECRESELYAYLIDKYSKSI